MNVTLLEPRFEAAAVSRSGASVRLRNVTRHFGDRCVLHGIDLHVPAGQFVAIVGRSGCGKSTLLRLIAGLDAPSSGTVEVDGDVRLMFQEPRLLPWERVARNVELGLGPRHDRATRQAKAAATLAQVGLADRAGAWPAALSGGQRQRVALARSLVSHPRLLAFDEPLGALDALTRIEMQDLIETVWREAGCTAIMVTHDVSEAVTLADRVLLIEDGDIAEDVAVPLPRPRRHGDPEVAALEGRILERLLRR